jgi:lysozyme
MSMHQGIDVSAFQGHPDFRKVADSGRRFVHIKATEGGDTINPFYRQQQADAREAGLHSGFYHFLRPRPGRNGAVEADWFWRHVEGVKGGENGAELLRLTADIEASLFTKVVKGETVVDAAPTLHYAEQFLTRLERLATHEPILYTFPSFITDWGARFKDYRLWIAHPGVSKPTLPRPWTSWVEWQDNFHGRAPGVAGDVDTDRCPVLAELILERNEY